MKVKQSLKHELIKLLKKTRAWLGPILVFILIMVAYPLTVELTNQSLADAFFPVLFISCLMVMMLATEGIFLEDYEDGSLEHLLITGGSIYQSVFIKILVHWCFIGIPVSNFWIFIQYWSRKHSLFIYFAFAIFVGFDLYFSYLILLWKFIKLNERVCSRNFNYNASFASNARDTWKINYSNYV